MVPTEVSRNFWFQGRDSLQTWSENPPAATSCVFNWEAKPPAAHWFPHPPKNPRLAWRWATSTKGSFGCECNAFRPWCHQYGSTMDQQQLASNTSCLTLSISVSSHLGLSGIQYSKIPWLVGLIWINIYIYINYHFIIYFHIYFPEIHMAAGHGFSTMGGLSRSIFSSAMTYVPPATSEGPGHVLSKIPCRCRWSMIMLLNGYRNISITSPWNSPWTIKADLANWVLAVFAFRSGNCPKWTSTTRDKVSGAWNDLFLGDAGKDGENAFCWHGYI